MAIETTAEKVESKDAAAPAQKFMQFPQDQIQGDGFTQLDPNTGWLWVGINLNKFNFRDAWAFIKSQEFSISQYLTTRENAAMLRAQLAANGGKADNGIGGLVRKLGLKN